MQPDWTDLFDLDEEGTCGWLPPGRLSVPDDTELTVEFRTDVSADNWRTYQPLIWQSRVGWRS